jgi:ectoine hydroxylase-related dioxygenase (phytanoyl-CoA dioxygenase family)
MPTGSQVRITEDQKRQYREEGFFILHQAIPPGELEMVRSECASLVQMQDREMDRLGTDLLNLSKRNSRYFVFLASRERPQLRHFIFHDRLAEVCKATIGENAMLFWEQFVVKGTDTRGASFGWHQDSGYCDGPHKPYVNAWIPLDDVNEENGTVYLLSYGKAGTRERIEHRRVPDSNDREGYFGTDPGVPAICSAGSIVVFSSTLFHRSGANHTAAMRRAYAIQFSPEPVLEPDGSLKGLAEPFLVGGKRVQ